MLSLALALAHALAYLTVDRERGTMRSLVCVTIEMDAGATEIIVGRNLVYPIALLVESNIASLAEQNLIIVGNFSILANATNSVHVGLKLSLFPFSELDSLRLLFFVYLNK